MQWLTWAADKLETKEKNPKSQKFIYSSELVKPLWIIAFSISIPVIVISIIAATALIIEISQGERGNPVRSEHLQQHKDDHEKYDRMIELLEEMSEEE